MTYAFSPVEVDDGFEPKMLHEEPVHRVARETCRAATRVFRSAQGFEVALSELVVLEMLEFARQAAPMECYALVVGRLCEDSQGRHLVVDGVVLDADAHARESSVETSVESELRVRELARRLHPLSVPVGWFHTHPRYGTLFSSTDRSNQATWTQDHSVGLVADPWASESIGVYLGPRSERLVEVLPSVQVPRATPTLPVALAPVARRRAVLFPLLALVPRPVKAVLAVGAVVSAAALALLVHELRVTAARFRAVEAKVEALGAKQEELESALDVARVIVDLVLESAEAEIADPVPGPAPAPPPAPSAVAPSGVLTPSGDPVKPTAPPRAASTRPKASAPGPVASALPSAVQPLAPKAAKPKRVKAVPSASAAPSGVAAPKDGGA